MINSGYVSNRELIDMLFNVIINDELVKQVFDDVDRPPLLYDTIAPPEPALPHLVHRVRLGNMSHEDAITEGAYFISIYTFEQGTAIVNSFVDVLVNLLNNQIFSSDFVPYAFLSLTEGGEQIETGNGNIKRYDLPFELRYSILT